MSASPKPSTTAKNDSTSKMGNCPSLVGSASEDNVKRYNERKGFSQENFERSLYQAASIHASQSNGTENLTVLQSRYAKISQEVPTNIAAYEQLRNDYLRAEATHGFQHDLAVHATADEVKANEILNMARLEDEKFFSGLAGLEGHNGYKHPRFPADRFLFNREAIEKTSVYKILGHMPKGGHLHIHFNAALGSDFLLGVAKTMENMCIKMVSPTDKGFVTVPLLDLKSLNTAEVQFQIVSPDAKRYSVFEKSYSTVPVLEAWMSYKQFRQDFLSFKSKSAETIPWENSLQWLESKLYYSPASAYDPPQTVAGSWVGFNARTRFLKGLFNYETAFRRYTLAAYQHFVNHNIQYAEIRPNFMRANNLFGDDGKSKIQNRDILEIIVQTLDEFNKKQKQKNEPILFGVKVIYCFPRSFSNELVAEALNECREFALDKELGKYIAGFDLVGEESAGKPLCEFAGVILAWKERCKKDGIEIPLLLHCGETLENGGSTDGNLYDALLLGAKRIGHGVAAAAHPLIVQKMLADGVCVELCPISNQVLGLSPRNLGHPMYTLLANNVPCTISTDNETIFQSSLSHDFYQVFIGKKDMNIFGLKQIALWSIEHAILDAADKKALRGYFLGKWDTFIKQLIDGTIKLGN